MMPKFIHRSLLLVFLATSLITTSCVSKKKYAALEAQHNQIKTMLEKQLADCNTTSDGLRKDLNNRDNEIAGLKTQAVARDGQLKNLEDQVTYLKQTNTNLLDRMADLSIVSKSGAESIRKSLDAINEQSKYIKDLSGQVQRKDSLNLALVMSLKRSLSDINDQDVQIEVKKGVVYISLSDKLLFRSGSAVINQSAETVLSKVAKVLNDHKELDILIEGHTDNVPISTDCVKDNWDLSTLRSTSVARLLQTKYSVDPARMIAGGSGQYKPKSDNATTEGKSMNRRTEIIITPKLDQFFQLLNPEPAK
ncbi:MAG: OmpA family protein [Saprospiraceae bacterium]|jgi:chemotaxis protein MotB|nr:OmpA family protein [Saprospiraceae bacterium]